MIDDPGWTAGSVISARPALGPMLSSRRSLATLPNSTASRRIAPEYATTSPMLCVTRKRFFAGTSGSPVYRDRFCTTALPEILSGVEARANRCRPDVQFRQLPRRGRDIVAAAFDARGEAAELLTERDRDRVLQVRPSRLDHVVELVALARKAAGELARFLDERSGPEQQRQACRRGEDVVRGLTHVDVIVRVDPRVDAFRLAENLRGTVRQHLVRVHVVRRAGARLVHVDDELIAEAARQNFVRRLPDDVGDLPIEPPEVRIRFGGRLFHENGGGDEVGRRSQPADREILDGARGLHAEVRVGRHLALSERITFGAVAHKGQVGR